MPLDLATRHRPMGVRAGGGGGGQEGQVPPNFETEGATPPPPNFGQREAVSICYIVAFSHLWQRLMSKFPRAFGAQFKHLQQRSL